LSERPESTVRTPWGSVFELKSRKLHPGSRTPRLEVIENQRERMFGAVIAVVSQKGYEATTVADVIRACGVSRSDFYRHFSSKAQCLAAAAEALQEPTLAALTDVGGDGDLRQAKAIFEQFIGLVRLQPAAARACFVELHAAGEEGEAVADRGFEALAEMVEETAVKLPECERMNSELVRALVGGLRKLIHTRLYRKRDGELQSLVPELWRWISSVPPPPRALVVPRRQQPVGARFEGYTPSERIARAVAAVVAEKGFQAMSTNDIAARASISLSTFYKHFADKRDAVLAVLEMSGAQMMASAVPAARRAGGWQEGVRALYEAMCTYFVAEPAMAELATVGVYAAGPQALARRDHVIDSLAEMLAPGFDQNPEAPAVSTEAIGASVYALMREQVRVRGVESLPAVVPLATYITLVGFVGPERACTVANGEVV
jgi:AcrR family transcriptional regulator